MAEENKPATEAELQSQIDDVEVVELEKLDVDHAYQRDLDQNLVQKIGRGYDMEAAGVIMVSRRADGSMWIVDGQHRAAGARVAGETHILARVVSGKERPGEALLRLKGNTRRGDKSMERFKAQVAANIPESLEIVELCRVFGTKINQWPDMNTGINSVASVEVLYRKDKGTTLTRVFEVIRDAFGKVGGHYASVSSMKSIAWVLERHSSQEVRRDRLIERLSTVGIEELERKARAMKGAMGGALWMNFYRAIIEVYNTNLPASSRVEWRTGGSSNDAAYPSENSRQDDQRMRGQGSSSSPPPLD